MFIRGLALLLTLLFGAWPGFAQTTSNPAGLIKELIRIPVTFDKAGVLELEAMVIRPAGEGRWPLVILNHGTPRDKDALEERRVAAMTPQAIEFARRGWAAVALMRRGFGGSEGEYSERPGACDARDFAGAGLRSARDIGGAIAYLRTQAYVDPTRIMSVGVSAGGLATMALASQSPPGLVAAINFAGGHGSSGDHKVCRSDLLVAAMGQFGRTARIPTLWIYAENDMYFWPELARQMFAAFTNSGGKGTLVMAPPTGTDGHAYFSTAIKQWRGPVDEFLRNNGLPAWSRPPADPAPPTLTAPSQLSDKGREAWQKYLASAAIEKAFAMGLKGGFSWKSGFNTIEDAVAAALQSCAVHASNCRIVAVNDGLASSRTASKQGD